MKIIDINEGDMRGDPRVWLTKAMTEEQAPRPTGKGPKGLAKSRHQITYLAHQAKERYKIKICVLHILHFVCYSEIGNCDRNGQLQEKTNERLQTNMVFKFCHKFTFCYL